jgi:peptidoglycan/xylan/chitin deacetylase (PgdA/CDA1 family)
MYHSVDTRPSVITFPPDRFQWQMEWLHDHGYESITLSEISRCMAAGQNFPERSVALTFDDGYQSLYTEVFPVLQKYGFSATVFLVAGFCGKDNDWPGQPSMIPRMKLLTWEQIDEMARFGVEFGSHTFHHPRLDHLLSSALYDEIVLPKVVLEDYLGRPVTVFAYPYGRYTDRVKDMVSSSYEAACGTRLGLIKPNSDRYALERVEIKYLSHPWIFQRLFHAAFPYYLSARWVGRVVGSAIFSRTWK